MIRNLTTKKKFTNELTNLVTPWTRAWGLMFSYRKEFGFVFILDKPVVAAIHMFFVFMPIDVLWCDENKKVIALAQNVKPFGFASPQKKCSYIVEVPAGRIALTKTKIGDQLHF